MKSGKLIELFKMKKNMLRIKKGNNINDFDIFKMVDFIPVFFFISRSTKIPIESNFWLVVYVSCIVKI